MVSVYTLHKLTWMPLKHDKLTKEQCIKIESKLQACFESWNGTPYMIGQSCKSEGVDCVRFVVSILDEMYGFKRLETPKLPQDAAMNNPDGAKKVFHTILNIYKPTKIVTDNIIEPGDVIITGPIGGYFGHSVFVGSKPNELWHSVNGTGVCRTGLSLLSQQQQLFRIYRQLDKDKWALN